MKTLASDLGNTRLWLVNMKQRQDRTTCDGADHSEGSARLDCGPRTGSSSGRDTFNCGMGLRPGTDFRN
jgi:hypothetical protein